MGKPVNDITLVTKLRDFLISKGLYTEFLVNVQLYRLSTTYPIDIGTGWFVFKDTDKEELWKKVVNEFKVTF